MRTEKEILRKVKEWTNNPYMAPGMHRLLIFLRWEAIPEPIRNFYPKDAEDFWNSKEHENVLDGIEEDINILIKTIYRELEKKSIIASFGLLPMLVADLYAMGGGTAKYQAKLMYIVEDYIQSAKLDRPTAEAFTLIQVTEFIKELVKKLKIELDINLDDVVVNLLNSAQYKLPESPTMSQSLPLNIDAQINQALAEYEAKKKIEKTIDDND